ncbi:MAG: ferredoxin family protein [Acidobacteria bacterium]|nr:ferredoxin family protein [Acidobacteriota bacterium]
MQFWRRPLDADTIQVPRGEIHILSEQCKGCGFCVEYCPREVLKLSDSYNKKGYHPPLAAKVDDCVHCQLCELLCPEFAIFVTPKVPSVVGIPVDTRGEEVMVGES